MLFTCVIWLFSFHAFFLAKAQLSSDATAYLVSSKDLVNFLQQGVWPLWHFQYGHGVPFDFFTQRMGSFNPLYTFMALLDATRIFNFLTTYTLVMSLYYFCGMTGFYFLINKIYLDRRVAFCGFILLLFSSLGARIFDSFLCLISVPLIWFFFFLVSFIKNPARVWLAGCIFTAMILCSTYVPFYFLMTLIIVAVIFGIIFWKTLIEVFQSSREFFATNIPYTLLLFALFLLTLIPEASFYLNSFGNISLPIRHGVQAATAPVAAVDHILKVDSGYMKWGAFEELIFSSFFTSVHRFTFDTFFVPLISLPLIVWGAFCRINKRIIFYLATALLFLCIGSPHTPIYPLFADHLFFFKYFRNLHFFAWFSALPFLIFLFVDFFYQILHRGKTWALYDNRALCSLNLVIHLLILIFLFQRGDLGVLAAWTITVSCVFIWILITSSSVAEWAVCLTLCLLVLPQGATMFIHLGTKNQVANAYTAPHSYSSIMLNTSPPQVNTTGISTRISQDYYATKGWSELTANVSGQAISQYLKSALVFYDQIKPVTRDDNGFKRIENAFINDENTAYVPDSVEYRRTSNEIIRHAHPLRNYDLPGLVSIKSQTANNIIFETNLPIDKFMVFNDSMHSQWHAYINGKETPLFFANIAFKGLWVPAGPALVEFRFSSTLWYWFNVAVWLIFQFIFISIIAVLILRARRKKAV